ncbi:DNA replication and repair protein RecF [Acidimicrobium ferrooxidans DSM 10331]|uniref:DNA replication and repair protein RecF n=1 Tax=Acidimicrobium ferrooxidans (strain DSM 10331 / JCM 15462 / NBRC 103882 / ICP) TaxID=525909 RepID=C7M116_ACIFD|nr:DNA replication and repair protein RecF [Acidimicrobium ferrooxidans]ACU52978.1 DNA replication and repair protein RecF [Acidimicrobium ferrooxidans DSM 10331]
MRSLRITGLRNLDLTIDHVPDDIIAVVGSNGHGKTSLLESVSVVLAGRSFRTHDRSALVRVGHDEAVVVADVERELAPPVRVGRRVDREGRLETRVDGQREQRGPSLPVVSFHPDDVQIASGGPEQRRRFLDECVVGLDRGAAIRLRQAERVLRQRTEALRAPVLDEVTLSILEERLARASVEVAELRARAAEVIAPHARAVIDEMLMSAGRVVVTYRGAGDEATLLEQLRARRGDDRRRGVTSVGFHRDDVEILLDGEPIRRMGSQGQVRTVVVALKVALARAMEAVTKEPPVLVLDDLLAELDAERARRAVAMMEGMQAFISHTAPVEGSGFELRISHGALVDA